MVASQRDDESLVRGRAVFLGLVLVPLVILWVAATENVYGGRPTYLSVFFHAVLLLEALLAFNWLAHVLLKRPPFTRAELLAIYIMVGVSSGIVGDQFMAILIPSLAHPFRFATPANRWAERLLPYLPPHAVVSDPIAVRNFYEGGTMLYRAENLRPWLLPGLLWAGFIAVTQLMCLAINVLMRRQWTDYEKLSFPLITLPMEMTAPRRPSLWRNRLMWVGFLIAGGIDLINGLHVYFPAIPQIPVKAKWIPFSPKWAVAMTSTATAFYPFIIGIGYLLPTDLTFSTWFFLLFVKFERFLFAAFGHPVKYPWTSTGISSAPCTLEQSIGAYMAIVVFSLWAARRHLASVWREVWEGGAADAAVDREAMEYRAALVGLVIGLILTTSFAVSLGMPAATGFAYILLYLVINTAIAKIRAEAGAPTHGFHFAGPDHVLLTVIGPRAMKPREMAAWGLMFGFNRAYTGVPMPHQLEGIKIGELVRTDRRKLYGLIVLATVLGSLSGVWALLHLCFREGVDQMIEPVHRLSPQGWQLVDYWLNNPPGPNWPGLIGIVVGFLFASFLMMMRFRFVWWQFHPIGYAIGADWTTGLIWMPLLIGWLWKISILRYAGPRVYRTVLPMALGLILGEFAVGGFWTLLAMFTRKPQYHFWT
ncbi:MAG: hypothetical protein H5T86_02815 [Armatimonadetes bacterium]|nr:hypothetical protein [Armatimonadota bacterium]